jgi:Tol biopolymer transport system component
MDIFVHDRWTGKTELVSINSNGDQGSSGSVYPSISADGRYLAFTSNANNLVVGDTNYTADIFALDRGEIIEKIFLPVVSSTR